MPSFKHACSSRRLDKLEAFAKHLCNLLILVLQLPQSKRNIVPLALRVAPLQAGRQLVSQLPSMFVL